jgi:hypothetical protein
MELLGWRIYYSPVVIICLFYLAVVAFIMFRLRSLKRGRRN